MLKDIATIKLKGAFFQTESELPLLSENGIPVKASLIYGRNGSGKSTIAKPNATKISDHNTHHHGFYIHPVGATGRSVEQ